MLNPSIEFHYRDDEVIKFYPYRTAVVTDYLIKVHLNSDDYVWLRYMLEDAGHQIDNHIVFTTKRGAYWLHDNHLYVGTVDSVKEGAY